MTASVLMIAGAFLMQARFGLIQFPFRDPCIEISGWDSVGQELQARGLIDRPNTFLFTSHWFDSGQVAFAVRDRMPVTCYRQGDARGFAYWSRPDDWLGKDGLLVDADLHDDVAALYLPYFQDFEELPPIQMTRGGPPIPHRSIVPLPKSAKSISIRVRAAGEIGGFPPHTSGSRNIRLL